MKIFPGKRVDELLNRIAFGLGSTPARLAKRIAYYAFIISCTNLLAYNTSGFFLENSLHRPDVLLGAMIFVYPDLILKHLCKNSLYNFFYLIGILDIFVSVVFFAIPVFEALVFLLALSWTTVSVVCISSTQAVREEQKVLEQGFLPVACPEWILPLCILTTACLGLCIVNIVFCVRSEMIISLVGTLIVQIMMIFVCLLRSCIPRPPLKKQSRQRIGDGNVAA